MAVHTEEGRIEYVPAAPSYEVCTMGKMKQYPRYNVLSVRLTDEEMATIESLAKDSQANKSEYARAMILSVLDWRGTK